MSNNPVAVLVSGGLDSDVLLAEMAASHREVYPIYLRQGLAWETVELYWLKRFLKNVHVRDSDQVRISNVRVFSLPMTDIYGDHWSTGRKPVPGSRSRDEAVFLPGRNLALSIKAAIFCSMNHIPELVIGSLGHNPFPDASLRFFREWGNVLSKGLGRPIHISAPYRQLSKAQVIRRGQEFPLELSFSCIAPKGKWHCGRCNKCVERRRAFKAAKVEDHTHYVKN